MAKQTENNNEETNNQNTGIATRSNNAVVAPENFDLAFAELNAELEESLKMLGVTVITSPTSLLPNAEPLAESDLYNLTDAFPFEITENGESKLIAIFVMNKVGTDDVITVGQGLNVQRQKIITPFQKARVLGANLTLTNVKFTRLDKGKKAGNYPIVLQPTMKTEHLVNKR